MPELLSSPLEYKKSIILIGMAGAGKSTLGKELARVLDWGHIDTDKILEAWWAMDLQTLTSTLSREAFRDAEAGIIQQLNANRCVISTGGSVVYRPATMRHLATLGPCIYLEAGLDAIRSRIAKTPDRGLSIAPEQSIKNLYFERKALYETYADATVQTDRNGVTTCVQDILAWCTAKNLL